MLRRKGFNYCWLLVLKGAYIIDSISICHSPNAHMHSLLKFCVLKAIPESRIIYRRHTGYRSLDTHVDDFQCSPSLLWGRDLEFDAAGKRRNWELDGIPVTPSQAVLCLISRLHHLIIAMIITATTNATKTVEKRDLPRFNDEFFLCRGI